MRLAFCSRQRFTDTQFAVHAASCSDVSRRERPEHFANVDIVDAESAEEFVIDEVAALNADFGTDPDGYVWSPADFKIYPCCAGGTS